MKSLIYLLITVSILFSCDVRKDIQFTNNENEKIAEQIHSFMNYCKDAGLFNGCALIARDNQIIYQVALGYSDIFTKENLNIDSKFDIGSLSKSFTAMAIMILEEQDKLSYDQNLRSFFPEFPAYAEQITIHHLLTHQSGIKDFHNDLALMTEKLDNELIFNILEKEELLFDPGTRSIYSNSGFFLLARIIEKVSGMSYADFMARNIFQKLKMKNTLINDSENMEIEDKAIGRNFSALAEIYQFITGPSGVLTTVGDLYKWHMELCDPNLVSKESIKRAFTASILNNGDATPYGYGWRVSPEENDTIIKHGGGSFSGYMSYFIHPVSCQYSIILLYNYFLPENFEFVLNGITTIVDGGKPEIGKTKAVYKLNKQIIENGTHNLELVYRQIKSDTSNINTVEEIDLIRLSSFYKNRKQLDKATAILNIYMNEFPNSLIPYEELTDIYHLTDSEDSLKSVMKNKKVLEEKLSSMERVEFVLLNPKTEDYEMSLRVRSGPGNDYEMITVIMPAENYTVIGKSLNGEWLKLKRDGWLYNRRGRLATDQFRALPFVRYYKNKAGELVENYVSKIGGEDALDNIEALSYSFEMNHLDENKIISRTIHQKRPNFERYDYHDTKSIIINNESDFHSGKLDSLTKEYKWTTRPNTSQDNYILKRFGIFLDYRERGFKLEYIGEDELFNRAVHAVKVILSETKSRLVYFDKETGLYCGFKPNDNTTIEVKGYTRIKGLYLPLITEGQGTRPDGIKWHHVNTITDLKINPRLDKGLFRID